MMRIAYDGKKFKNKCITIKRHGRSLAATISMKRVFKIGEVVWYSEDHERGWGKVGLINRSDEFPEYPCSDETDDILTIIKEGCKSEIECSPSNVYQVAQDKFFCGEPVVYEHNEDIEYPFYCPAEDENCFYCELD